MYIPAYYQNPKCLVSTVISISLLFPPGTVQSESAGVAEIEVTVLSPTGQNVPVKLTQQDDYEHSIEFVPQAAGHYKATVMYGGEAVPNSPITFAVLLNNSAPTILSQDPMVTKICFWQWSAT